ncbi:Lrp/AsnC family transcriptional regulator [Brevundimonas sp.]|uniref:Lrp/AsnC family transcriptional regulator n=1 Tax=Brevundimonas sp. TaxID=1871086 RepID=UPI001A197E46|nr:Lrp/AsnC family transcriptional regulator [Brevundimonas sp.]MBJ7483881.1 Lrp/AsnC family transcriptional regulator [Brevundimonas sp.]
MTIEITLDATDEKIVALLRDNGRMSNRAVGRELDLSESAVRKRLKRMIDANAIAYGLIVDVSASGMTSAGWLKVKVKPGHAREVADLLAGSDQCVLCAITSGEWAIRAYVYAETAAAMAFHLEELLGRDGVIGAHFRPTVGHTRHRYEYVILSQSEHIDRWRVASI